MFCEAVNRLSSIVSIISSLKKNQFLINLCIFSLFIIKINIMLIYTDRSYQHRTILNVGQFNITLLFYYNVKILIIFHHIISIDARRLINLRLK